MDFLEKEKYKRKRKEKKGKRGGRTARAGSVEAGYLGKWAENEEKKKRKNEG